MFKTTETNNTKVNPEILRRLISPGELSYEKFYELASNAVVETRPPGSTVCKTGNIDGKIVYLLKGDVEVTYPDGRSECLRGGDKRTKHPLIAEQPHTFTAVCRTTASIALFDFGRYESLTNALKSGIDVTELCDDVASDDAWMTRILQSPNFQHIAPSNLQAMFMRLEESPVSAGHVIIKQGDKADYYYIVKRGICSVLRNNSTGARVMLDRLEPGDVFGEEALLTDGVRNATVIMDTPGSILKLKGQDFMTLLAKPLLKRVDLEKARSIVEQGGVCLDIRTSPKGAVCPIANAKHTPLYLVRIAMRSMDKTKQYVCFCDDGSLSTAATYLLASAGFETYILSGGLAGQ